VKPFLPLPLPPLPPLLHVVPDEPVEGDEGDEDQDPPSDCKTPECRPQRLEDYEDDDEEQYFPPRPPDSSLDPLDLGEPDEREEEGDVADDGLLRGVGAREEVCLQGRPEVGDQLRANGLTRGFSTRGKRVAGGDEREDCNEQHCAQLLHDGLLSAAPNVMPGASRGSSLLVPRNAGSPEQLITDCEPIVNPIEGPIVNPIVVILIYKQSDPQLDLQ